MRVTDTVFYCLCPSVDIKNTIDKLWRLWGAWQLVCARKD
jgi:hypothetical protein